MFTREMDASIGEQVERRLREVDRALQKVEEGTYGLSDDSGETIPRGRLEAVPEALRIRGEQRFEQERRPLSEAIRRSAPSNRAVTRQHSAFCRCEELTAEMPIAFTEGKPVELLRRYNLSMDHRSSGGETREPIFRSDLEGPRPNPGMSP